MSNPALDVRGLEKSYRQPGGGVLPILRGLELTLPIGELGVIHGKSGSGKTTLLNILGLLDDYRTGEVLVMGRELKSIGESGRALFRNRSIGFVFQQHHLLSDFSTLENVMLPALIAQVRFKRARSQALELLEQVGLAQRADHRPGTLSGGECQRAAIARAFINKPDLILADEPTGSLDSGNAALVLDLFLDLQRRREQTVLVVSHDVEAFVQARYRFFLREGKLERE